MAMKPKAGFATKTKTQNYSTKWLRNALKSVGISSQEAIKEIAPNLYDVTNSGVTTSRNIINSLRKNAQNTNKIGDNLRSNKYVQYAQKAYRNAMSDIKTGNFNNQDRMNDAMQSSLTGDIGDLKEGFSFGDDGADSGNVNVNYINAGVSNDAVLHLSNQMQNQAKAQLATQKASMDAYIAVNAASMQQVGQIGAEIVGQLSNVNSNLAALVQYQNENMTKFIEASLAYYDHAGAAMGNGKHGSSSSSKLSAKDVFNSSAGGINMGRYKTYVKQQAKDLFEHSNIGLLKSLADDPMMMDMIVSNPIGFLSQGLVGHMIPTVLKTSLETMETTFTNFMPTMLSKIADMADEEGNDFASKFKRVLGKTFGLRNERSGKLNKFEINRGSISFDGETKHAITEIITKELRDQTGYLEIIANHFYKGNAKEHVRANGEYWSYGKNGYIKKDEIDIEIADKIVDSIRGAFNDTKFGKSLKANLIDNRKSETARKEMAFTIDELFVEIEKQKGHVTLEDLLTLIDHVGAGKETKKIIKKYVSEMAYKDRGSFYSLNTGRLNSQGAAEETRQSIMNDYIGNNLLNSSFMGTESVDEIIAKVKQYGQWSDKKSRNVRGINKHDGTSTGVSAGVSQSHKNKMLDIFGKVSSGSVSMMETIMSGDTEGVIRKGAEFISNGLTSIGAKLQELSKKEGGIIWQVKENFKTMSSDIKDGLMWKFFGKKKDDQGNYVDDDAEKGGIFGSLKGIFTSGFNGWMDAFFGDDDPEKAREEHKTAIAKYVREALPNAITGSMIGAGINMAAGSSYLGMLLGGPMASAALGAAVGFLSKNEKFQHWLFGKDNEDGSHTEGLISKKVQDYFKKNKTKMIGGVAAGAITGHFTGGGLLGQLVGGPIAGSILGMATTVVANSDMFKKFLFGDKENGQKGVFKAVADAFNRGFNKNDPANAADGKKTLGMGLIGGGIGSVLGKFITPKIILESGIAGASLLGPIGGALMGLALSIKAQSGTFRQWLFGEKDGLDLGDGRKAKKQGVLGQLGNQITASIINPMKHEIEYIAKDFMSTVKGKVLYPFAFLAESLSGKFGELFGNISAQINGAVSGMVSFAKDTVKSLFAPTINAIGGIMKTATDFTWKTMKHAMSIPGNVAGAIVRALDLKEKFNQIPIVQFAKGLGKDIRSLVFKGIKGIFKLIGATVAAPFKLLGLGIKGIFNGASWIAGKAVGGIKNAVGKTEVGQRIINEYRKRTRGDGTENDSIIQRMNRIKDGYKQEQAEISTMKKRNKIHDANARLISKATKGQFGEDSEEARTWLKYHNPAAYKKLVESGVKSITEEAEIEKNGESTKGKNLDRTKLDDLSEEGKQTKLLYDIRKMIDHIIHKGQGKTEDFENDEERDQREQIEREREERKQAKKDLYSQKVSDLRRQLDEKGIEYDPNMDRKALARLLYNHQSDVKEAPTVFEQWKTSARAKVNNVKNFFQNDLFSHTRANYDKYVRRGEETWTQEFLNRYTNGKFTADSHAARSWLQTNNPEAYAKFISRITGKQVKGYSIGGVVKKGLSVVGEKGAELLYHTGDGTTAILDADSTEEALVDASRKKKKNKLSNWMKKISGSSLENHSDEQRADHRKRMSFLSKRGSNIDATAEAALATVLEQTDMRRDSLANALGHAKTQEQLKKEREEEKEKEEQKKYRQEMLEETKKNTASSIDFHNIWSRLWHPKKGMIMVAGVTAYLWLRKKLPKLFNTIESLALNIGKFAATTIGGFVKDAYGDISWTEENNARTNGNTAGEQAGKIAQDVKDGNFMTDGDGEANTRTEPMLRVLARTAMNVKNSKFKMPFESKLTKAEKGVANVVKWGIDKGAKAGNLIGNYLKNTDDLAKWALQEGDEVLEAGTKAQQIGAKLLNSKVGKTATTVINKGKGLLDNALNAGKNVLSKGKNLIDNGLKTAKNAVTNSKVAKAVSNVVDTSKTALKKVGKDDGLLTKVTGYIDEFFTFLKDGFKKKFGKELGEDALGNFTKNTLLKTLKSNWDELAEKIAKKLAIKGGGAAISAGVSEIIFATIGAINGVSGTAKLFQVNNNEVDGTMKLIAGIFGGLAGTTAGSIIDLVLSLLSEIMGTDILHNLAVGMYNAFSGENSEKIKKLENAQSAFKDAYIEDRNSELESQYNTQKQAGIISEDVTLDMFIQGVEDGTFVADSTSFQDYNVQKNKSFGDKIGSGLSKAWKNTKHALSKKEKYKDTKGNTYTKNADGTWQVKNSKNKDLGYIANNALPKDAVKSGGKGGFGIGGRGPAMVNGFPYYSQNDSRWGNNAYTSSMDRATMANTGCGPTAMAMVASGMGRSVTPMDMAGLAKMTGNRDATGTNWNFVNQVSPMIGLSSRQKLNPSAKDIDYQLSMGNPVLLSGVGSGSGSDPYTRAGHYVVAVGKDANNNILINDPRGMQYSKAYNLNNVASRTGSSWTFGGRGPQIALASIKDVGGSVVSPRDRWVSIVQSVKKAIAAQSPGYSQSKYITITVGGRTLSVRTDCSGMVAAAAKLFGAIGNDVNLYTGMMMSNSCPLSSCFTLQKFPGWDKLQIGDILVKNGHTEVYAGSSGGKYYVYNCGSNSSVNNPGATTRSYSSYTHIWSPGQAGASVVANTQVSDVGNQTTTTTAPASTSSSNKFGDLTSMLGSFFTEFSSRALSGDFTNTDYSHLAPSSETTGGSGNGSIKLSKRDVSRLRQANQKSHGGRGLIDYSSGHNIQSKASSTQYTLAGNAQKYITVTKDSSISALMVNAIEILAAIAGNTSDTSTKLNALGNLQNLNVNGGNSTNIIVGSDGKSKVIAPTENSAEKRNTMVAKQIARGGY